MEEWADYLRTSNQRNRYGSYLAKLSDMINKEVKALAEIQDDWLFDGAQAVAEYDRIWPQYHNALLDEICAFKDHEVEREAIDMARMQANTAVEDKGLAKSAHTSAKQETDFFADNTDSDCDSGSEIGLGFGFGDSDAEVDDSAPIASASSVRIVETAPPAGWTGASMRDLVTESVHRIDSQAAIKYSSGLRGSGYASSLTVTWSTPGIASSRSDASALRAVPLDPQPCISFHDQSQVYEVPGGIFGRTRRDAEDYVALVYLFAQAHSPQLAHRLPPSLRSEWDTWDAHIREAERTRAAAQTTSRVDFLRQLRSQYVEMATASLAADAPEKSGEKKVSWSQQEHYAKKAMRIRAARWTRNVIPERQSTDKWKSKYAATQAALPACQYTQTIADALAGSQTVVIRGATGCGKTTQVPQIALRLLLSAKYKGGRILCTQPRRISATSISQRVSLEVGDGQLGTKDSLVGFQVRLHARAVDENPLVFCTTGVLLRMLVENPKLEGISCVICDEVQERTLELDYLLIVLRRLLAKRPDLKVILMSATIDTRIFTYYFDSCPVVDIPGRTFPVTNMYLENVIQMSGYVLDSQSFFAERPKYVGQNSQSFSFNVTTRGGNLARHDVDVSFDETRVSFASSSDYNREQSLEDPSYVSAAAWSTVSKMRTDVVNLELIHHLIRCICSGSDDVFQAMCAKFDVSEGAILVFLPGIFEIRKLHGMLGSDSSINRIASIVPLHSAFSNETCPGTTKTYTDVAFEIFPEGRRKVVLATNIAETGITIPDVTIVIDSGVANQAIWDKRRQMTRIETATVSKANVKQRSGRAGRVQKGLTLCLFSSKQYALMPEYEAPEMHRLPLIGISMMVKMHGFNDISGFLAEAIDPPLQSSVAQAIHELKEAGALDEAEDLTPIGRHLCYLPVDLSIGKMLIVGTMLNCMDPVLTLAAAMSLGKPMLIRPFDPDERVSASAAHAKYRKYKWLAYADDRQASDLLVLLSAYEDWRKAASAPGRTRRQLHDFCKKNWINRDAMDALEDYREQYLRMLHDLNLVRIQRSEHNKHVPLSHLIRPRAGDVPGFRGGFTEPPANTNVNGTNVNIIYAAIIAGFDHIVMPAATGHGFEIAQVAVAKKVRGVGHAIQIEERGRVSTRPVVIDRSSVNASPDHPLTSRNAIVAANLSGSGDATFANMSTRVNLAGVALFARSLTYWPKAKLLSINRWIDGKCFAKTALVLVLMRNVLQEIMNFRVASPLAKLPDRLARWQTAIVETIRNEDA
ncbi:hypothetical protein EC988_001887 [Linderina pennispora]|nr:hypothetical protein EC988_001887 [Linderina pennispora]